MEQLGPPISRTAGATDAGRNCPYCRFAFKSGADLVACGVCGAAHHADCWADNGGCAIVGCAGAPAPPTTRGRAAPPPPPTPRPAPPPPPYGAPPASDAPPSPGAPPAPPRREGLPPAAIAGLTLVLAVSIAVTALALTGNLGGDGGGSTTSSNASSSGGSSENGGDSGESTPARSLSQDRSEITAVLRRYESAYTNHDTESLKFVFTPTVTRHGLANGGCRDASGRPAVLQHYRDQFALGTGVYTLRGLTPNAIRVDADTAHTDLGFSIQGRRSGEISFDLARFENAWRVSRVDSHC